MSKISGISSKRLDFIVLLLMTAAGYAYAVATTHAFIGRNLLGGIVFCLPGTLYLGFRATKPWKKILIGGLIFGLLFGSFFELIQQFNKSYIIAFTVLPKLFHVVALDFVAWHVLMSTYVLTFYEHFVNKTSGTELSRRGKPLMYAACLVVVLSYGIYYVHSDYLQFTYPYVFFGAIAVIPAFVLAFRKPYFIRDMLLVVPFFFLFYMVIESAAVPRQWWVYGGSHYIGWVTLGGLRFPFEELLFWMLLYPATLVAYYKLFIDKVPPPRK